MADLSSRAVILADKLVDELYVEAMVLADEARSYLDAATKWPTDDRDPAKQMVLSCESLKVTTRLMQVIAWLLSRRAFARGEIDAAQAVGEQYRLGDAAPTGEHATVGFPSDLRVLIATSESLYQRALRLEEKLVGASATSVDLTTSPARDLMERLNAAF